MKVILSCSLYLLFCIAAQAASDPTKPDLQLAQLSTSPATEINAVAEQTKLKLGLIKNVQGQHMALINGQSVKPGDQIEGYTVLSISRAQVVLQQGSERLTLSLFKAMKTQ